MNAAEDDDVRLQRSSVQLLSDIHKLLPKLLRKKNGHVRQHVKETEMYRLFVMIESFQEDPQLLDAHLKSFIPDLVAAYLDSLRATSRSKGKKDYLPLSHVVCQILNLFCKVRGEKVIKSFLNNEPRYLEPILSEFEKGHNFVHAEGESLLSAMLPWTERYVLLLWLSHLMLAPFPLASMSTVQPSQETSAALDIDLPSEAPEITLRVLTICLHGLKSATKERGAAANLLVRLCVRPDMQELGLLKTLVNWALSFFTGTQESSPDIHQYLGVLSFLSGLVASATNEEIGPYLPNIYQTCHSIVKEEGLASVNMSAVARKLIIKTFRNIVVHCLNDTTSSTDLDATTVVEEVVEYLLEALADGDTPVRYAASKALSIVTMKLEPEMAADVVEAILGSLSENVYWQGTHRNLSGVNPLQWHGLTLTLSHLLYRRAVSTTNLPDILNALLLALAFEQRSANGGSIGTNVRDAACFGIWAVSRRYTTKELLAVQTSSVRASEHFKSISILQVLAMELLVVACLDPAGNIRRGSSAALQELVGRSPDTVDHGITLVQIVDFHAVGLRERAMCDVAIQAGALGQMYWEALFEGFLGWRGTGSLDAPSRVFSASAIGLLSANKTSDVVVRMADQVAAQLKALKAREIEERQGLVLALSALVDQAAPSRRSTKTGSMTMTGHTDLTYLWRLMDNVLRLDDNSFISAALRPAFTASAICHFLGGLAMMTYDEGRVKDIKLPTDQITRMLNLCLGRSEDSVLEAIPRATRAVIQLLSETHPDDKDILVAGWLQRLENEASYNGLRCSGYAIALGAAYSSLNDTNSGNSTTPTQARIIKILTFRCTPAVAIEARIMALQALNVLLQNYQDKNLATPLPDEIGNHIASALHIALNDYTVTERGDVGSLVRLEALATTETAWSVARCTKLVKRSCFGDQLYEDVLRLSLEKIDKMRARAAKVLEQGARCGFERVTRPVADGASSYTYFSTALMILLPERQRSGASAEDTEAMADEVSQENQDDPKLKRYRLREALCLGLVSSAGMGSESVVQNSRAALLDTIGLLPTESPVDSDDPSLLSLANCLVDLLKQNLDSDRTLLPLLEVIAFLFDMQIMHRLIPTSFNFRRLLSLTQKAHFKSSHMQKLHLAIDVYRGLATIPSERIDTLAKLVSMLLHPFPNVRIKAAETLWILTHEESLKRHDWSLASKSLKPALEEIKRGLAKSEVR